MGEEEAVAVTFNIGFLLIILLTMSGCSDCTLGASPFGVGVLGPFCTLLSVDEDSAVDDIKERKLAVFLLVGGSSEQEEEEESSFSTVDAPRGLRPSGVVSIVNSRIIFLVVVIVVVAVAVAATGAVLTPSAATFGTGGAA